MIRVVYRWRVTPENFDAFCDEWRRTTNHIHATVAGAQGSFMLRAVNDSAEVQTIAKWDSYSSWEAFWGNRNPQQMERMRTLGERVAVDVYEEIEDNTR